MELTVDQALQQGVAAHKEGKLEEAEAPLKKDHQLCAFQILFHNLIQTSLPPFFSEMGNNLHWPSAARIFDSVTLVKELKNVPHCLYDTVTMRFDIFVCQ